MSKLLGRRASGTLRLESDSVGLWFEIAMPDTQLGRDTLHQVERGDARSMSFAFRVPPGGDRWPDRTTRQLVNVELVEISVLTGPPPAYDQTSLSARAKAFGRAEAGARIRAIRLAEVGA